MWTACIIFCYRTKRLRKTRRRFFHSRHPFDTSGIMEIKTERGEVGMVELHTEDFDIAKIADSGQCFRLAQTAPDRFCLTALGRVLTVDALPDGARLHCTEEEFTTLWRDYFDLNIDYARFRAAVPKRDRFLSRAAQYGRGIRILRQDPWEMLITFIISQRKNIPAIQRSVELLSRKCGRELAAGRFAFPTPERLAELTAEELAACSLGYRAGYVHAAAALVAEGTLNLAHLCTHRDCDLLEALTAVPGVGPKVANCVALFGYHRLTGFPRDVWINRILDTEYRGHFPLRRYTGFEGVIQQYMFYYARSDEYRVLGDRQQTAPAGLEAVGT